ncbi:MAG: DEAD/DEAH box helicase [Myxococcota bacterium]
MPPDIAEIELAFYERFFFSRNIEPYPVQEQALNEIFAGNSALVTVPTGTGKTLMAKAAMFKALELGQKAVYTTPLRALTEEKFRELGADFGVDKVGLATGDYKINRTAPLQVEVAEILWNRIFGQGALKPADVVIMDEGHYFNDMSRGYVWEQSIIGLDPRTQLIILSATVGRPERFCHWVELTRRLPMTLVESRERRIPLHHEYREDYLIDVVRELNATGDIPAIIFVFAREKCFEVARLLKSCRRFTSDEERERIDELSRRVLIHGGVVDELRPLLLHGIGIHHAGILPRYKQLVEELALERLIKFVVSTETIAAGINLPAKTVVFPALKKHVRGTTRLVKPAEFHQMAGRAGRPQFDDKGLAICLAPEDVVQDIRKEIRTAKKKGYRVDEEKIRKSVYGRARTDAARREDVTWDRDIHDQLVKGEPAELRSKTKVTAEQVLAIGLPDLEQQSLPGAALVVSAPPAQDPGSAEASESSAAQAQTSGDTPSDSPAPGDTPSESPAPGDGPAQSGDGGSLSDQLAALSAAWGAKGKGKSKDRAKSRKSSSKEKEKDKDKNQTAAKPSPAATPVAPPAPSPPTGPAYMNLNIVTVVDNLLMSERARLHAHKTLAQVTANMRAIGVIDAHGKQIAGQMIRELQGLDGPFIYYALMNESFDYDDCRELIEYLIDHDVIQKRLNRKEEDKKRAWIRERLRERRRENGQVTWEDVEQEYEREFPRELSRIELIHQRFAAVIPHPELHGGKLHKRVWAEMEDEDLFFTEFVDKHSLAHEEGNLFSYLIRVMNFARTLNEVTTIPQFASIRRRVRDRLAVVDLRLLEGDDSEF